MAILFLIAMMILLKEKYKIFKNIIGNIEKLTKPAEMSHVHKQCTDSVPN